MIDAKVFRVSREAARARLAPDIAADSFGYYIDVPNDWESARAPENLIGTFGIHKTHQSQFPEIIADLGPLSGAERDWAWRFADFYDRASRMLATTGVRAELQYDIAETLFDWRTILKFVELPARILDYGAGGGRQGVSAFLHHTGSIYAAVDSTLAAYTVQNVVYSLLDAFGVGSGTVDFLDYEAAGLAFPRIADAVPGQRFHIPAWMGEAVVPERFFTLITACHVHNELSRSDFLRLVSAIDRGLADDGIVYMRSELWSENRRNYFDCIDFHNIDPVAILAERGIVPIHSVCECAFQTTVFARQGSIHHRRAAGSGADSARCLKLTSGRAVSMAVAEAFTRRCAQELRHRGAAVLAVTDEPVGAGHPLAPPAGEEGAAGGEPWRLMPLAAFEGRPDALASLIRESGADAVVLPGDADGPLVQAVRDGFGQAGIALRRRYRNSPVFLYRNFPNPPDPIFLEPVRSAADLGRRPGGVPDPQDISVPFPASR